MRRVYAPLVVGRSEQSAKCKEQGAKRDTAHGAVSVASALPVSVFGPNTYLALACLGPRPRTLHRCTDTLTH